MTSQAVLDHSVCITAKSITTLCNIQDLQTAVLSEADMQKRFNLASTGAVEVVSAVHNGDVQYFCRVREDTAMALFNFHKHKNCTCLVNKVLFLISTCCHSFSGQNNFKFLGPNNYTRKD